jgi:hypothetical protein
MLTWNTVLTYIKGRLALPTTFIEKSDQEIINWIKMATFQDFSDCFPDIEWTYVNPKDAKFVHESKKNHFYFYDDEDLDIYGIRQCYFEAGDDYITGHPPMGSMSFEGLKWWGLEVFKSRFFKPFSYFSKTYIFIYPNIVRVLPECSSPFVIEYERQHPPDLRKIPNPLQREFMDLALADIMMWLGNMRSHYGDGRITTPWGEIPLNGDQLKQDGADLRREVLELLREESLPPVIIDVY